MDVLAGITSLWCTQQGLILLFSFAKGFLTPFERLQSALLVASAICALSTSRWYSIYVMQYIYSSSDENCANPPLEKNTDSPLIY